MAGVGALSGAGQRYIVLPAAVSLLEHDGDIARRDLPRNTKLSHTRVRTASRNEGAAPIESSAWNRACEIESATAQPDTGEVLGPSSGGTTV